jgi:hypothetical protein
MHLRVAPLGSKTMTLWHHAILVPLQTLTGMSKYSSQPLPSPTDSEGLRRLFVEAAEMDPELFAAIKARLNAPYMNMPTLLQKLQGFLPFSDQEVILFMKVSQLAAAARMAKEAVESAA